MTSTEAAAVTDPAASSEPNYIDFDQATRDLFHRWEEAKAAAEQWEQYRDDLGRQLMDRMGDRTHGTIDGRHVVTKIDAGVTNRFDAARFRDTQPDLYADYVVPLHRAAHLRLAAKRAGR